MGQYSIKELEALSGIKAHTIRIWEKRHNIIQPERTDTNIRLYSDDDLKRILNVSILYNQGYKISKIVSLSKDEMTNKINEISSESLPETEVYIDQLTVSMVELDELKFNHLLSQSILKHGFEKTMIKVIYPFLRKIGVLWLSNHINPAQEHFISNLIRQKVIVAIDGIEYNVDPTLPTVVFFLPENELHEIGLLFYYYLIKKKNYKTYYFGQDVPFPDLKKCVEKVNADILIGTLSYVGSEKQLTDFLAIMAETFHDKRILMSGKPMFDRKEAIPESIELFRTPEELNSIF